MRRLLCVLPVLFTVLPACSRFDGPKVYPVAGEVFYNGQPAMGAMVRLHPTNGTGRVYAGVVEADGSFHITTNVRGDGAPEGQYAVTLQWSESVKHNDSEVDTPDAFGGRYADPSKPLQTVEVKRGENRIPRFDLN